MARWGAVSVWSLLLVGCRPATQVTVDVSTDVECARQRGTSISAGAPGRVDGQPAGAETAMCATREPRNEIGSIVLVPGGDPSAFGVNVVLGVDRPSPECHAAGYDGCIIARRAMSFLDHTELFLPVALDLSCKSVPCDPTTTCVAGGDCVDARIPDPSACDVPDACEFPGVGGGPGLGPGGSGAGGAGGLGGGGGDGGMGASGGGPIVACGGPGVLQDDFDTPGMAPGWVSVGPGMIQELGGELVLLPLLFLPNTEPSLEYRSMHAVDLTGRAVRVAATTVPFVEPTQETYLQFGLESTAGAWISAAGGQLGFHLRIGGTDVLPSVQVSYDPVEHRFWQIRESGGTLFWEVSKDGVAWTDHRQAPKPPFTATGYMMIGSGSGDPGAPVLSEARFDDFNAGVPAEPWCPAASLVDGFDDPSDSTWWPSSEIGACKRMEISSAAQSRVDNGTGTCTWRSASAFDLTDSSIAIETTAQDVDMTATAFFELATDTGNVMRMAHKSPSLIVSTAGTTDFGTVASPQGNSFWRIRHTAAVLYFEGSSDGVGWNELGTVPYAHPVDTVEVRFGLDAPVSRTLLQLDVAAVNP